MNFQMECIGRNVRGGGVGGVVVATLIKERFFSVFNRIGSTWESSNAREEAGE